MKNIIIKDSLFVTFVVSLVIVMAFILADATSKPIQVALGSTNAQIHDSQNMTFMMDHIGFMIFSIIGTFILSLCMLTYLEHGK